MNYFSLEYKKACFVKFVFFSIKKIGRIYFFINTFAN